MSKHHQSSRRRSYGRRQHELHERIERRGAARTQEPGADTEQTELDGFSFFDFDLRPRRLSFAVGD